MRDLFTYVIDCMEKLDHLHIAYGNVIDVTVNTRARKRWGQCCAVPGGYTININSVLLDERNGENGLIETIIHELLHTCRDCMNHGQQWKNYAEKVNAAYGYNIKRASDASEKGVVYQEEKPVKYKFICLDCGQVITRQRKSQFTEHYSRYRCGRCGGQIKMVFDWR